MLPLPRVIANPEEAERIFIFAPRSTEACLYQLLLFIEMKYDD